ncbi:hypothetical protein ACP90_06470 [Labrenzia sp. CP4]|jgi:hypothetical protein|uniref:hypothetical protein n=1 Tax=Stappiaceae TaxID=2821832 RepID=UPI00078348E6|nr:MULTISPECIES: hypothetical protein [Stappiaceae]AMN52131.1 hypothetical protein ACP90_06470 [Labrenzia sp. CP4]MBN8181434.1 hypothetical protein [Roseibium aggregatum]UES43325.1 hypothetical protein GFK90_05855 [Roseibium aggregatum]WJS04095.1 hypothetical protein QUB73_07450 [Roseibium aggregatum]
MFTHRKRIPTNAPTAIAIAALLASSLIVAEPLFTNEAGAETAHNSNTPAPVEVEQKAAPKGDLKVELADVHGRPMRCVSGTRVTTCTGWPISHGMLAFNSE